VTTFQRHRRMRSSETMRQLVQEHSLQMNDLIYPLFISELAEIPQEVPSMPGIFQLPLAALEAEILEIQNLGIKAVLLFGIPKVKDSSGSQAYASDGIVQEAIQMIKSLAPQMLVIADTCLCEYTNHGHCGLLNHTGYVLNDESLPLHCQVALAQAKAGADIIAPSNCMDGCVAAIRQALDRNGFELIPVMGYSNKFASSFYGPFRDAADSAPKSGDRKSYQMNYANNREAIRELMSDIEEGADFVMVKPAMAFLDIVKQTRQLTHLPIVAYNVSGEYAMVKAAAAQKWIDEPQLVCEILTSMKRAGADLIITYHAKELAQWLK